MNNNKTKVAIVGTNGIPARYGGYETLAEYLTKYLSSEFDFTVYSSIVQPRLHKIYNGSKLIYFPLGANGWQSIFYDFFTLFHAAFTSDVILYLGPGAGYVVPFLKIFRKRIIVNHGGLNEWEREKYSNFQRFVAKMGHKYGALFANFNIGDPLFCREWTLLGLPCINLNVTNGPNGLPVGVQLIAGAGKDHFLLSVARAFAQALPDPVLRDQA